MILSMEEVATTYLEGREDVLAAIVSVTPPSVDDAWVKVTQIDPQDLSPEVGDYFVSHLIQFDCYAGKEGGKDEADLLTRTVRAALREMRDGVEGAVVSQVTFTSCPYLPDPDLEPARPRYSLSADIYAHA